MNLENDTPTDVGTVVDIREGNAVVEFSKSDACTTCKLKTFCFFQEGDITSLSMTNTLSAKVGDIVQFEILPQARILSSFLVFIVPILFLISTYFLCRSGIGLSENLSILLSLLSVVLSFLLVKIIDLIVRKRALIQPRMKDIIQTENRK